MKQPRITDFDPNALPPELASPLDNMPIIEHPIHSQPKARVLRSSTAPTQTHKPVNPGLRQNVNTANQEAVKPATQELVNTGNRKLLNPVTLVFEEFPFSFSSSTETDRKETFMFTSDESESLERMKFEIRHTYDIRTTKNEIIRIALHHLANDYHVKGKSWSAPLHRTTGKGNSSIGWVWLASNSTGGR